MKWIWLVNSDENTPNTYGDFTDSFTVRFTGRFLLSRCSAAVSAA